MNEPVVQQPMQPMQPTRDGAAGKSAGTLLREAREAAGLHVGALAVSLKVPVKKLEALEADDLEQLPDAVFARALAATICRLLKVDPEPVLARLPQLHRPPLQVGTQEAPVRLERPGSGMRLRSIGGLPRPVVYLSALLLVAAFVLALMPSLRLGDAPSAVLATEEGMAQRAEPQPPGIETTIAVPAEAASASGVDAFAAAAAAVGASAAADAAMAPVATPAASDAAAAAATTAAAASAGAAGGAVAVFSARAPSWVQVVDAAGLVHLRKTMNGGETARINGTLPLSVVVGRANAMDVVVRGQPLDVQALAKDNTARFQIK